MSFVNKVEVEIPDVFLEEDFQFVFFGFESESGDLQYREDKVELSKKIVFDFKSELEIEQLIIWGYKNNDWVGERYNINFKDLKKVNNEKNITPTNVLLNNNFNLSKFNEKVTCVFLDEGHASELKILEEKYREWGITNIKYISGKYGNTSPFYDIESYAKFCLTELCDHIDTEFVLISHWDGFILNLNQFFDEFYDYDYIGAPWYFKPDTVAGNGGFSLRSKKFLQACKEIFTQGPYHPEDENIENNSSKLIELGIKFAPKEVASKFSLEGEIYKNQLGFHGLMTQNLPDWCRLIYKNKFYHSGDLGDVMYSLPVIKELGGGVLVLSQDYHGMELRDPMVEKKCTQLKKLLTGQSYIVSVEHIGKKPSDIDYDLNNARQPFIDWGAGKFTEEEINTLRFKSLISHYEDLYELKETNNYQYYFPKTKKIINGKPIILNRTARYNNKTFPWQQLVDDFKDKIIFVGLGDEYTEFCKNFGKIDYHFTKDYYELMEVIAGAKLFIGNQSFPYSIAEAMKQNCVQETDTWVGNCQFKRHNSFISKDGEEFDYNFLKYYIERFI